MQLVTQDHTEKQHSKTMANWANKQYVYYSQTGEESFLDLKQTFLPTVPIKGCFQGELSINLTN